MDGLSYCCYVPHRVNRGSEWRPRHGMRSSSRRSPPTVSTATLEARTGTAGLARWSQVDASMTVDALSNHDSGCHPSGVTCRAVSRAFRRDALADPRAPSCWRALRLRADRSARAQAATPLISPQGPQGRRDCARSAGGTVDVLRTQPGSGGRASRIPAEAASTAAPREEPTLL